MAQWSTLIIILYRLMLGLRYSWVRDSRFVSLIFVSSNVSRWKTCARIVCMGAVILSLILPTLCLYGTNIDSLTPYAWFIDFVYQNFPFADELQYYQKRNVMNIVLLVAHTERILVSLTNRDQSSIWCNCGRPKAW